MREITPSMEFVARLQRERIEPRVVRNSASQAELDQAVAAQQEAAAARSAAQAALQSAEIDLPLLARRR